MAKVIDYEFKAVSTCDFILHLEMTASHKLLKNVLDKAKKKVASRLDIKEIHEKEIDYIKIPEQYHRLLLTFLKRQLNKVYKEVKDDGITIIRDEMSQAYFEKLERFWNITIIIKGLYER